MFDTYAQMCSKRHHIIVSKFSLKFKCKICVQKEVIHNFKNHILVTWLATNLLILGKWCGFENQITIILFKILPNNCFSKAKSYSFYFYKNNVTWPPSANGPLKKDPEELVQNKFLKWLLGVNKYCNNKALRQESSQWELKPSVGT